MENFKKSVPAEIQNKLKDLAENLEFYDIAETCDKEQVSEISGNSYDGFMAFQRGGFEVSVFADNGSGPGSFVTEDQEKFIDNLKDQCEKDFREENEIDKNSELTDEQLDELLNWESDYLEPLLIRSEMWVEDEKDEILFRLSINYKDAPYYRGNHDEDLNEFTMTFIDFLNTDNDEIIKKLLTY